MFQAFPSIDRIFASWCAFRTFLDFIKAYGHELIIHTMVRRGKPVNKLSLFPAWKAFAMGGKYQKCFGTSVSVMLVLKGA